MYNLDGLEQFELYYLSFEAWVKLADSSSVGYYDETQLPQMDEAWKMYISVILTFLFMMEKKSSFSIS
jgi:hypothetical protein